MSEATYKYFAFISYSRMDSKAAKWLQHRLEWFRFPLKLVSQPSQPLHPKYIRPVYRDKTSLEVDHAHYWENIKKALSQSRYLIVLCSPEAALSGPVDKEVRYFLSGTGRQDALPAVVPVILKGNVGTRDESECLCPALLETGGLITGRNLPTMVPDKGELEKDGWENGFTGVASYLLQLKRDALRDHCGREERKRAIRFRMLSGIFALLSVLAVAGGIVAWYQRGIAEKNRLEAVKQTQAAVESEQRAVKNERLALRQLAASRLRNSDRFGALRALNQIDFNMGIQKAVAAGVLCGVESIVENTAPGSIFRLNNAMYLKTADKGVVELDDVPAVKYTDLPPNGILLVSESGFMRLINYEGKRISDYMPEKKTERLCYIQKIKGDEFKMVLSLSIGTSACSLHYSLVPVNAEGFGNKTESSICYLTEEFSVHDPDGRSFLLSDFQPFPGIDPDKDFNNLSKMADITLYRSLNAITEYELPMNRFERDLWTLPESPPPQSHHELYMELENTIKEKFEQESDFDELSPFLFKAYYHFHDEDDENDEEKWDSFRVYPKILSSPDLYVMSGMDSEGMGGYSMAVCVGAPGAFLQCSSFSNSYGGAGYNGFRLSQKSKRIIVYGAGLSMEDDTEDRVTSNIWVMEDRLPFHPLPGLNKYGRITDACFGPDHCFAVLTQSSSLIVYDTGSRQTTVMGRLKNAVSVEWLNNGKIAVLTRDGKLFLANPGNKFEHLTLGLETLDQFSGPLDWITKTMDGNGIMIGSGYQFIIYHADLLAPLTNVMTFEDNELPYQATRNTRLIGEKAQINPDGSIVLDIHGSRYIRTRITESLKKDLKAEGIHL